MTSINCMPDAPTQEILLDDFMGGVLYSAPSP